jgi:hypothetical protein
VGNRTISGGPQRGGEKELEVVSDNERGNGCKVGDDDEDDDVSVIFGGDLIRSELSWSTAVSLDTGLESFDSTPTSSFCLEGRKVRGGDHFLVLAVAVVPIGVQEWALYNLMVSPPFACEGM